MGTSVHKPMEWIRGAPLAAEDPAEDEPEPALVAAILMELDMIDCS
jgi:hypothetical protein